MNFNWPYIHLFIFLERGKAEICCPHSSSDTVVDNIDFFKITNTCFFRKSVFWDSRLWLPVGIINGQCPVDLFRVGGGDTAGAFGSRRDRGCFNSLCGQLADVHIRNVDWHRGGKPELWMIRHAAKQLDYRLFWLHHITHLKINLRLAATRRQYAMKQQNDNFDKIPHCVYRIRQYIACWQAPHI